MTGFLENINSVVWGFPMLIFFLFTAIRFTAKSHFFQITGVFHIVKTLFRSLFSKKGKTGLGQFATFCSVLGACLGTGNIVGVATAIYYGGPGVVFWMWVSSLLSMMTAYAENYLGVEYTRSSTLSGAFAYIEKGVKIQGLSKIYAFFCLASSLGMGNMTQSNSLAQALTTTFNLNKYIIAIPLCAIVFLIIRGGLRRIANAQTITVPIMTVYYFIISFLVMIKFRTNFIPCVKMVVCEAFSTKALTGYGIFKAIRYGISRGVFSNEAGLGSSTLLHAEADENTGETQGIWAMFEVFTDTVIMCTITAFTILVSTYGKPINLFGAELTMKAYSTIGKTGGNSIGILTAVFAFTSLSACSFYGEKSFTFLFGKRLKKSYKYIYAILVFLGAVCSPKLIWIIADICNGLMALPNLFALNCLAKEVVFPKTKHKKENTSALMDRGETLHNILCN